MFVNKLFASSVMRFKLISGGEVVDFLFIEYGTKHGIVLMGHL